LTPFDRAGAGSNVTGSFYCGPMLFATTCAGCGQVGASPCAPCVEALVPMGEISLPGLDRCLVLLKYDTLSLSLITALKYRGLRAGLPWLTDALAQIVVHTHPQLTAATWVPASNRNRRRRGFDQSKLLARPVARRLGIPAPRLLDRTDSRRQTGRTRAERLRGPSLVATRPCVGETVLLVDDVVTTGASMSRSAETLRTAGAISVVGLAVAHRRFEQ